MKHGFGWESGPDMSKMPQETWSDFAEGPKYELFVPEEVDVLCNRIAELERERDEARAALASAIGTIKSIYKDNGEVWLHDALVKLGVPEADIDYWREEADG